MRLAGKSIVISGATGIAAAGARKAAEEGAVVFVVSRGEAECRDLVTKIESAGGKVGFHVADLTVEPETETAFDAALDFLGGIDGVFAVAGGSGRRYGDGPAHEITLQAWQKTFEINTIPMFLATSRAIGHMRENGGSVVIVSSVLATSPSPGRFDTHAYAAAKGAANSYVTTLAAYYADDDIRVNAIAPGLVRTPMSARAAADPDTVEYSVRKQRLAGGFLEPVDIANTAVFLLSDESSRITGQIIAVDGGWGITEA
jgi:NAD(P)-dependent dehydrogenase (short-subunit alcohol dehydrogenase family)